MAGFAILVDPSQYDIPFPQLEVNTSRAFLKTQPDVVTRYMRAIIEGIYTVKQNPEPSINTLKKYLKIDDREALEEVYPLYQELYQPIPHPSPAAIQTQLTDGAICARSKIAALPPSSIRNDFATSSVTNRHIRRPSHVGKI